jgi:hypothetical protein
MHIYHKIITNCMLHTFIMGLQLPPSFLVLGGSRSIAGSFS